MLLVVVILQAMHVKKFCSVVRYSRHVPVKWRSFSTLEHSPLGTGPVHQKNKQTSFLLKIAPEVADAVATNKPVVALESTIVTHGMPYPENLKYVRHYISE